MKQQTEVLAPENPDLRRRAGRVLRVILIEDSAPDAQFVQELLSRGRSQFSLTRFDRLHSAIDYARSCASEVDVVIMGLRLPGNRALELLTEMRPHCDNLPIILLADTGDDAIAAAAMRVGAEDFLVKGELDTRLLERSIVHAIERRAAHEGLRASEERYALAIQGAGDGLWDWDLRTNKLYMCPRCKEMLGLPPDAVLSGLPEWLAHVHPHDLPIVEGVFNAHLNRATAHLHVEHRTANSNSGTRWVLVRGVSVRSPGGKAYRIAGSFTDISERKRTENELIHNAFHDPLTGLANRALFLDRVGQTMMQSERRGRSYQYAIFFLDLDRFKQINDSLGHSVGDQLLIACARRLQSLVRSVDTVSRLGGDEFVLLLNDAKRLPDVCRIAERIVERLAIPFDIGDHRIRTSASIGIAVASSRYKNPEELVCDADTAMYRAKAKGTGRYEIFDRATHRDAIEIMSLEDDLGHALERGEFSLQFQPVLNIHSGRLHSFEALLRWNHPSRGLLKPGDFLDLADGTRLIIPMGGWVLTQACRQAVEWQKFCPGIAVSVNLSLRQINEVDIVEQVASILEVTGLDSSLLMLELPETATSEDPIGVGQKIVRLGSLGVRVIIDDFGTGYSSLTNLEKLPCDMLKIDRSFVSALTGDPASGQIIRAMNTLARNAGIQLIAGGIETLIQLEALRTIGCELGQGLWFSPPLEPSATLDVLRQPGEAENPAGSRP